MQSNISRYIILLICSWWAGTTMLAQQTAANNKPIETVKQALSATETDKKEPLIRGVALSADLFGMGAKLFGADYESVEVAAELNLCNRYFPIVEVGYGRTDNIEVDKDIHYKMAAPYFRVGVDYNFNYKKPTTNRIFVGARCGFTSFSYDVAAPDLVDPIWGGTVPFNYTGEKSNAIWAELVVGIRTQIVKNFYMGWTVRYKGTISVKKNLNSEPWYIPGFGVNGSDKFGATYNLIYLLPW